MATYNLTQSIPAASSLITGDILNCPYSGAAIQVTLPKGTYKLECWGAQGGTSTKNSLGVGGLGGYAAGTLILNTNTILYLLSGGQGSSTTKTNTQQGGGFNGGGHGTTTSTTYPCTGGGGASDIRIGQNSLYARVIVAGGGGGGFYFTKSNYAEGGRGGGTDGSQGHHLGSSTSYTSGVGGSQTSPGTSYFGTSVASSTRTDGGGFGQGANALTDASYSIGGGGGWYGGGSARRAGGGGGSGYVYNSSSSANYPSGCLLNSDYYLSNTSLLGAEGLWNSPDGATESGHSGNGYVRITCTSIITSVTITYDWGGSLTYSQVIRPGTDSLIWKISDFPTDYKNNFQTKLNTDVTIDGINFDEISIYKNSADGSWIWPTTSTSQITGNLTLYPLFHFQATKNIRIIRNLSESTHTNRGNTSGTLCGLNSEKKFNLTESSLMLTYTVNHSDGLYPLTYNQNQDKAF